MSSKISLQKVQLIDFPKVKDSTGILHFLERADLLPEGIKRAFWISEVSEQSNRGKHAHLRESQVLVAVSGIVEVWAHQAGQKAVKFSLDRPNLGVFIPALTWVETKFSKGAILLGFSNQEFSESDYIRNLDEFEKYQ
ncbi:sugar 3,4-ketoisomerase [Algoriphagus hitonicola]|uniref:WxcM-like, C-terminal n=1 Tax=Algoriphagus hitonicola TaxID=435880 RepID=A0A1I2NYI0_9BACT|nr:FdtA/QdtA family cupin domain-containing protein [Algoriphagus hitonicola]SFG09025.1 WxcM-like, C-terminal [Algoriphagus hitonicola]